MIDLSLLTNSIIYPKVYNAFKCAGYCSWYGIPDRYNYYGLLLYYLRFFTDVHEPCCVGKTYGTRSFIVCGTNGAVTIKHYPKMAVNDCECR